MYDHKKIESKWQARWADKKTFSPDLRLAKKPFYNLMMFPYPSGAGLHVGHTYAFGGADAYGRFQRLQGHTVFEPMGFDAFGIHSENFAIKQGQHPRELIDQTTAYYREKQMKRYGGMWDWSRQVDTTQPDYYHWTQWIFVQLFKAGLAQRKAQALNWCPSCKTVLSDEQVEVKNEQNVCERCKTVVEKRKMEQWFFKITDYAERLLDYHETDWPETTQIMQTNWIGRKEGINIEYEIEGTNEKVVCFTTRPDTNFGATFIVLSPEHPLVQKITTQAQKEVVTKYVQKAVQRSDVERIAEGHKKTGAFTGRYAINKLNGKKLPIWVADFVLMNFGTGAVVGVPGHDLRDFEFAQEFGLPVVRVVVGKDGDQSPITKPEQVYEDEGTMVNSEFLDGLEIHKATQKMMDYLEEKGWGKRTVSYRLRDWCISRQRYWGPPIPLVYCEKCARLGKSWFSTPEAKKQAKKLGQEKRFARREEAMAGWYPVEEKDLPVKLPYIEDYQPKGEGVSPLAKVKEFVEVKCPHCGAMARRETDVSDTFLDSAWYFLRYPSVGNSKVAFDPELTKKWLPVDQYIGGNEHACLHLLYCRFVTMALHDLGWLEFEEPFKRFFAHGLIIKDGAKMSKSRGNVINPEEYIDKYGADGLRMYLLFLGPLDQGGDFRDTGMRGMTRFLRRLYQLVQVYAKNIKPLKGSLELKLNQTIKKMGEDYASLKFNTAIAALMELANVWTEQREVGNKELVGIVARLMAPVAPHLAEEFWEISGGKFSVLDAGWPEFDAKVLVAQEVPIAVQINGKTRGEVTVSADLAEMESEEVKKKVLKVIRTDVKLAKYLTGQKITRQVFVPRRLVSLVVDES